MRMISGLVLAGLICLSLTVGSAVKAKTVGVAATAMPDTLTTPPSLSERALVPGHSLVVQERVTTGAMGPAQLLMLDQSAVTVSAQSELTIDAFVYDPNTRTGQMAINLSQGLMRYAGGRISKNGAVNIETPVATMGVRGGIAHVNVLSATVVEVTLVYGEWIRGKTRSGQSFELTQAGEYTRIELGELPTPPVIIPTRTIQQAATSLGIEDPGAPAGTAENDRRGRLNRGRSDGNNRDAETARLDSGTGDRRDGGRRNRR